jgi:hypothetical protein
MWFLDLVGMVFGGAILSLPIVLATTLASSRGPRRRCPHCRVETGTEPAPRGDPDPVSECEHCHRRFRPSDPPDPDDGGLCARRPKPGPQVVGQPCAVCGQRVIFDIDAEPCPTCDRAVHLACLPHRHGTAATPYRD